MVDGVDGPVVVHSVVGLLVVPAVAVVGSLLWGLRGAGDVRCSVGDTLLNWYQDPVTTVRSATLCSVCSVHGTVVGAEVKAVVGGGGDEVVIATGVGAAEVVLINGL